MIDYSSADEYFICRSGWSRDAKILSVWWHCEHGFTHGINWRRLCLAYTF